MLHIFFTRKRAPSRMPFSQFNRGYRSSIMARLTASRPYRCVAVRIHLRTVSCVSFPSPPISRLRTTPPFLCQSCRFCSFLFPRVHIGALPCESVSIHLTSSLFYSSAFRLHAHPFLRISVLHISELCRSISGLTLVGAMPSGHHSKGARYIANRQANAPPTMHVLPHTAFRPPARSLS